MTANQLLTAITFRIVHDSHYGNPSLLCQTKFDASDCIVLQYWELAFAAKFQLPHPFSFIFACPVQAQKFIFSTNLDL